MACVRECEGAAGKLSSRLGRGHGHCSALTALPPLSTLALQERIEIGRALMEQRQEQGQGVCGRKQQQAASGSGGSGGSDRGAGAGAGIAAVRRSTAVPSGRLSPLPQKGRSRRKRQSSVIKQYPSE